MYEVTKAQSAENAPVKPKHLVKGKKREAARGAMRVKRSPRGQVKMSTVTESSVKVVDSVLLALTQQLGLFDLEQLSPEQVDKVTEMVEKQLNQFQTVCYTRGFHAALQHKAP